MGAAPHMKKKGLPTSMQKDHMSLEEMQLDKKNDASDIQNIYDPFATENKVGIQLQGQNHQMGMANTESHQMWEKQR